MNLKELIKSEGATLIDVRELEELQNDGHIESAVHIPLGEIPHNIDEIEAFSKPIIIFCRSGYRSGKAVEYLENQGLEDLYNGGGYNELSQII